MENQPLVRFDKEISRIVKGFALILMMILHFYGQSHYDVELDFQFYPFFEFLRSFKICVAIFTFMVGYGYAFSKTKNLHYGLQHIKKLLIPYWIILFVFSIPFCMDIVLQNNVKIFVYNLFGITDTNGNAAVYLKFGWFVYFYIYSMVVMPFVSRFIDKRPIINSIFAIIFFLGLAFLVHSVPRILAMFNIAVSPIGETNLPLSLFYCFRMTPTLILGYLFAHQGYYERIKISLIPKIPLFLICVLIIVAIITTLREFTKRYLGPFNIDAVYALLMIGAVAVLFNKFKWTLLRKIFSKIGELSVYLWFFQGLFFTEGTKRFYQPAITIFNDVNLVALWAMILTFFASWLIKTIVDAITKRITSSTNIAA